MRRLAFLSLFAAGACFGDPRAGDAFSTGNGSSSSSESMTDSESESSSSDTTTTSTTGGCTMDDECSDGSPICDEGSCVACTELGIGGCQNRDPMLPACDPGTGACVECNEGQQDLCGGATPVCVNNACAPCTANEQCESGTCLFSTGECLAVSVDIQGRIYQFTENIGDPMDIEMVSASNVDPVPSDESVSADGMYELTDIPAYSLVDVNVYMPQVSPVNVFDPIAHTVASVLVQNDSPVTFDVPFIPYSELGRIAFECMPGSFNDLADAQGTTSGTANTLFLSRSTIFGRLVDLEGDPLPEISLLSISAKVDGWTNTHLNEQETNPPPPQTPEADPATVCWLEEQADGKLHVVPGSLSDSGLFVMFRVRGGSGLGKGLATVKVAGYDSATVNFESSGNIGYVELARNDESVQRDFERDIYPIFSREGCTNCHFDGGPKDTAVPPNTLGIRDGFNADWSLSPDEVYDNLTGPGTTCLTLTGGDTTLENRICTDSVLDSLFVRRPTADTNPCTDFSECSWQENACSGNVCTDIHPVDIFPSIENPTVLAMREWIEQGAMRGTGIGPMSWVDDIYPIFENQGCVGCHKDGGPPDGMGGVLGERDGFAADWSLTPAEVYALMTGPGTTCLTLTPPDTTAENRICTDDPENSLFVIRPLVDPPDTDDPHPVVIFPTIDHPDMEKIIAWISQGAQDN